MQFLLKFDFSSPQRNSQAKGEEVYSVRGRRCTVKGANSEAKKLFHKISLNCHSVFITNFIIQNGEGGVEASFTTTGSSLL